MQLIIGCIFCTSILLACDKKLHDTIKDEIINEDNSEDETSDKATPDDDTPDGDGSDYTPDYSDIDQLPEDIGGEHIAYLKGATEAEYGYYAYTPSAYKDGTKTYPLIISLHGVGKRGNSKTNPDDLNKVIWLGPGNLIKKGEWHPSYPFIVVTPQTASNWSPKSVHQFIEYIMSVYRINDKRIYITGNSMGGMGVWNYISQYGEESYAAAVIPICGTGDIGKAYQFTHIPVWAFHGSDDTTVKPSGSINMVNAIKELGDSLSFEPKLTIYPDIKHDSWTMTYTGAGIGKESSNYDAFNMSIYDWLLRYKNE